MSTALSAGARITLKGLVGSPHLNGTLGTLDHFNKETGRWKVKLQNGQSGNLKPENLEVNVKAHSEAASFEYLKAAPTTTTLGSYYGTDPDGYKSARHVRPGDVQCTNFDHKLYTAMSKCLADDGAVSLSEYTEKIWPEIADGRGGKRELTCNERWTIRYGLGEFNWQFEARARLMHDLPTIDVMGLDDKKVTDQEEMKELLHGPSSKDLGDGEPPAKKLKPGNPELIFVDGMYLDKAMLKAVRDAVGNDRVVDSFEAVALFHAAADGGSLTRCERWTLRFILSAYIFTDAAINFIKEALAERPDKLKYTDSLDA